MAINRGGMWVRPIENGATAFVPPLMHSDRDKVVIDDEGRIQIEGEERFVAIVARITHGSREETRSLVAKLLTKQPTRAALRLPWCFISLHGDAVAELTYFYPKVIR